MSKQQSIALQNTQQKLEAVRKNIATLQEEARYAGMMDLVRRYGDIIEIIDRPEMR